MHLFSSVEFFYRCHLIYKAKILSNFSPFLVFLGKLFRVLLLILCLGVLPTFMHTVCVPAGSRKKKQILSLTGVSDGCKLQCGHWKLNQEKSCSLLTVEPPLQIVFSFKSPVSNKLLNICNRDKGPESGPRFTGGARQPGQYQAALLHWLLHHSGPPSCVHHHHLRSPAELELVESCSLQH